MPIIHLPDRHKPPIHIDIQPGQHIRNVICNLNVPPYLTTSIHSAVLTALQESTNVDSSTANQVLPHQHAQSRQQFLERYQSHTLLYNSKPEEDIFPRAYHTLVHCPLGSIFDALLELEQNYAVAIQELYATSEQELNAIHGRHERELETPTTNQTNRTHLFARHVEEIEIHQATWVSDIMQTQQNQRQEFRAFVIELYREYQSRLAALPDQDKDKLEKMLDGKDMIEVAASRINKQKRPRQDSIASQRSASSGSLQHDKATAKMVQDIQEMGFAKEKAEAALAMTHNNMEQAVMLLIENPDKVVVGTPPQNSGASFRRQSSSGQRNSVSGGSSPAHSRNSSWNETGSRRQSIHRNSNPPGTIAGRPPPLNNTPKTWSPISFLQQQKQVMESTGLSSVRKLGGWLGKAMENLGLEQDGSDPRTNAQQLVESFTISLGNSQVKSSHNLRLLVTDTASDLFHPLPHDPTREMAYKAQTAAKLYTSNLSAIVVLVELRELQQREGNDAVGWRQYRTGKGSNKALFARCQHATEFHFPSLETQLEVMEEDLKDRNPIQEGTFLITRHSNLPHTQVVFHLIIDSEKIGQHDISNRNHPVILGLRRILGLATRFDIASLSIPLLLLPDSLLEQPDYPSDQHLEWLQKRAEVVMKCVKGFLTENSRNSKHIQGDVDRADTVFGGGLRNVEFLLPNTSAAYGLSQVSPQHPAHTSPGGESQEVEFAFQQFRSLLVNLFRTS